MKFREVETAFVAQAAVTSIVVLIMLMLLKNQREIESSLKKFAAKEELEKFAAKEELQKFAAKDELPKKANQEELRELANQVTQLENTISEAHAAPFDPYSPYAASATLNSDESAVAESIRELLGKFYAQSASAAFDKSEEARNFEAIRATNPIWNSVPEELKSDFFKWVRGEVQDDAVPERLKAFFKSIRPDEQGEPAAGGK